MTDIAIFGAGQLGSYLCRAAKALNLSTLIVSEDNQSPALQFADKALIGEVNEKLAQQIANNADIVTFEREDISADIIKSIDATRQCTILPKPSVMALIADKGTQKTWLTQQQFPTAPFALTDGSESVATFIEQYGGPFVQKTRTGGFDGRGVQVVQAEGELWPVPSLVEPFVVHEMEIAVLVARSTTGELAVYPVVELAFETSGNILKYALSPARIAPDIALAAQELGKSVAEALDTAGLIAVELFVTSSGDLLINEISPRVHNSGHLTIEANRTSQFEQHLRAISGLPLASTEQTAAGAVMANILYEKSNATACQTGRGILRFNDSTQVHWYDKSGEKPLRKMGHVTSTADTLEAAMQQVNEALNSMTETPEK